MLYPQQDLHVGITIFFDGIYPGIFRPHVHVSVEIPAKWNNFSTKKLGTNPTEKSISSVAGSNYHAFSLIFAPRGTFLPLTPRKFLVSFGLGRGQDGI